MKKCHFLHLFLRKSVKKCNYSYEKVLIKNFRLTIFSHGATEDTEEVKVLSFFENSIFSNT
jgi:hypothetical protein